MATVTAPMETVADLLEHLGSIPAERVILNPAPGSAAVGDVVALLEAARKRICELVDGVLVEKAMGYAESLLAGVLVELLRGFVRPKNLGLVTTTDGAIQLWAGRVRAPDVAYFSWDRLPNRRVPSEPVPEIVPNLAIEVLSLSNTAAEMQQKREDYFRVGVEQVWEVDPDKRAVTVWTASDQNTTLVETDTLDGGDVLPGFSLPLATLFAELDLQG